MGGGGGAARRTWGGFGDDLLTVDGTWSRADVWAANSRPLQTSQQWAHQGSNLEQPGYEPGTLTN